MDLTPQSTRAPNSPLPYDCNPQNVYEYPSPAQSDSRYPSTESGLGIYSCSMSGPSIEETGSVSHVQSYINNHHQFSQAPSSILSAEYDPFGQYQPAAGYTHDIYSTSPAEVAVLPVSPALSLTGSQRSSFSSAPASEVFTQAGSIDCYTPRVKMEGHPDFTGTDPLIMGSPQQMGHSLLSASPYESQFYHEQAAMGWSKVDYSNPQDLPSISALPLPPFESRRTESLEPTSAGSAPRKAPSTIARIRQPRKLTTKEDANFQCHVKGCGKLFGRSYNFKAHMETHDSRREYPFPCPVKDCNKKFVRKTDLQRHHQSVHMKQRNHKCDYCSRFFARKDTLRRHMEDGCSKRFDIETVDFRPQTYSPHEAQLLTPRSGDPSSSARAASFTSPTHDMSLTSAPGSYPPRQDFLPSHHHQQVWSH